MRGEEVGGGGGEGGRRNGRQGRVGGGVVRVPGLPADADAPPTR